MLISMRATSLFDWFYSKGHMR